MVQAPNRAAARWAWRNIGFGPLIVLVLAVAGGRTFAELADAMAEGATRSLGRDILLLLRCAADPADPIGPAWLEESMRDLTALGGAEVLTLARVAVADGTQWAYGAVACSEWTGVRLRGVLKTVGVQDGVVYTAHYGADDHRMNGADLHPMNGAPLRLVMPGWPGS